MSSVLKQSHQPELIFGLVAPIGVDLDRVTDALTELLREMEYGAALLRLTSLMKEVPTGLPLSAVTHIQSYKERIAYANAVCNRVGREALAAMAISAIRATRAEIWDNRSKAEREALLSEDVNKEEMPVPSQAYIIRQFKRPEEIRLLRSVYGRQFILVSAYCPQELRLKRIEELDFSRRIKFECRRAQLCVRIGIAGRKRNTRHQWPKREKRIPTRRRVH